MANLITMTVCSHHLDWVNAITTGEVWEAELNYEFELLEWHDLELAD
jgi:hypothetical protein